MIILITTFYNLSTISVNLFHSALIMGVILLSRDCYKMPRVAVGIDSVNSIFLYFRLSIEKVQLNAAHQWECNNPVLTHFTWIVPQECRWAHKWQFITLYLRRHFKWTHISDMFLRWYSPTFFSNALAPFHANRTDYRRL